jgi:hypothetical protein
MGLEENEAVVQRLFDAINNGRLDELRIADGRLGMLTQLGILPDLG